MPRALPEPIDRGRTHYEGCWRERGHHNCAIERIAVLEAEARTLRAKTLDDAGNVLAATARGQERFGVPGKVMTDTEAARWAAECLYTMAEAERVTNTTANVEVPR